MAEEKEVVSNLHTQYHSSIGQTDKTLRLAEKEAEAMRTYNILQCYLEVHTNIDPLDKTLRSAEVLEMMRTYNILMYCYRLKAHTSIDPLDKMSILRQGIWNTSNRVDILSECTNSNRRLHTLKKSCKMLRFLCMYPMSSV